MDPNTFENKISTLIEIQGGEGRGYCMDANPKIIPIQKAKTCEDCGQNVVGRTVQYFVKGLKGNRPYWLKNCGVCKSKEDIGPYIR